MVLAERRRHKQWGQGEGSQGSSGGHGDPGETPDPAWGEGLQGGLLKGRDVCRKGYKKCAS